MADEKPTTKKSKANTKDKQAPTPVEEAQPSTAVVAAQAAPTDAELTYVDVDTDAINRLTLGELVLAYPQRDVSLMLDGATAGRVLAAFARPERRRFLQDHLDTATSSMRNLWATFDLDSLLAVSWYPGLSSKATQRMTVDPPSPTAIAEQLAESEASAVPATAAE